MSDRADPIVHPDIEPLLADIVEWCADQPTAVLRARAAAGAIQRLGFAVAELGQVRASALAEHHDLVGNYRQVQRDCGGELKQVKKAIKRTRGDSPNE